MNRLLSLATALVLLLVMSACTAQSAPGPRMPAARIVTSFDPDWRFFKGDAPGAEQPAFSDAAWRSVNVPHDWSVEQPYDQNAPSGRGGGYLATGISWYRKSFTLPPDQAQRRIFIEFDGIITDGVVEDTYRVLENPALAHEMAEHNFQLAKRHYSYTMLQRRLHTLLADCFGEEDAQ